ncbi:urease subunit gamma [Streptomyces sp. TRM66268-LWL]|uniref:Urease subunit gamma n=1 Tax=Streptomyces polyasparticus TaxID=2767826 RepID=A0ABR7SZJ8_9ACTN|nr:urease subunit gamma [Streptomyces polyasparticus]MBC9719693.1 urease subunit gamma [Streptomyces polyasparticus]
MGLHPTEGDRLMVHLAASVAKECRERGVKLSAAEAEALLLEHIHAGARDGRTVAELTRSARELIAREDVLPGVPEMITEVSADAVFLDGTHTVVVTNPIK